MGREAFEEFQEDFEALREDTLKQLDTYRSSGIPGRSIEIYYVKLQLMFVTEQRHGLETAIASNIEKLGNYVRQKIVLTYFGLNNENDQVRLGFLKMKRKMLAERTGGS